MKTYINFLEDTFPLVHDKVLLTRYGRYLNFFLLSSLVNVLSSDYPEDTAQAQSYVLDLGITKIISIVPAELPLGQPFTQHERFHMANSSSSHLGTLDAVCRSVHEVIDKGGQALLYCANESELCVAACAFCEFHLECRRLGVTDAGVY